LQTNDRPNIQTYALCIRLLLVYKRLQSFFLTNAFINVCYIFFDVYHIYALYRLSSSIVTCCTVHML